MPRGNQLTLPTSPLKIQEENRAAWNQERPHEPDFYTIGYAGRDITAFLELVKGAGIATVVDVRFSPISQFKPDFSKSNLQAHLLASGVQYIHRKDFGVPRDIRVRAVTQGSRDAIWLWYDAHVLPRMTLQKFFNWAEHPVALLCSELDPTACHRHRLAVRLEAQGLRGRDL